MTEIRPFRGIHYVPRGAERNVTARIAPPYDVLSATDKDELLRRDAHNFVAIDLPHVPPKQAGPPAAYQQAATRLEQWLAEGAMTRDASPALYVYHQSFEHAGAAFTRKMFFARLRLVPFGQGSVFPHEQTFGGPKEDRLALTQATRANLSPIFGLYPDGANRIAARLESATSGAPLLEGDLDGTRNHVWAVSEPKTVDEVCRLMADKAIYIADGHHRYGTGLLYRDWLAQKEGSLPPDHPANFVLCVLCALEDAGLLILPTHRVLPGVRVHAALLRDDPRLELLPLPARDAEAALAALAKLGPQAVGLYTADDRAYAGLRPRDPALLDTIAPEHSPAWRRLGLAFLHAYLLDRVVNPKLCGGKPPEVHYVKSAGAAVDEADSTGGAVFLMQPTTMDELSAVCKAGDLMPQKSTFFYPKLASGLLVNLLHE